ncbi:RNA polymerase sigma-70 factor [Sunxiuqinia elliptica]|uniref:RNA polymerase sigma-70 factor, ECF subfamily n=1 Tax=Sunxiuqinia elliptica TaxID=655355 RepID=A0A1I2G6G5_9BACT|nr:RNA polymerase sigma-70 factor [Sunxiuqinia elliptica]SFF12729.1 RNA polymerase sigma-70 factor, ECF subfamily [Sunxiuqinia elliptica]
MNESYLIEGLNRKDKNIFDLIFKYYYSGLCTYAYYFLSDEDSSEDLVQELFLKLWLSKSAIIINTSLKAYLFTAIKNRCTDFIRHQEVKQKHEQSISKNLWQSVLINEFYTESELDEILEQALKKIPEKCRYIFCLSRFEGKTNNEIAISLGLSKRTVETHISNALKILRVELADYLPHCVLAAMGILTLLNQA